MYLVCLWHYYLVASDIAVFVGFLRGRRRVDGTISIGRGVTVEVGVGRSVNAFDVFDGFGGALVAGRLQLALAVGPVAALVDLRC